MGITEAFNRILGRFQGKRQKRTMPNQIEPPMTLELRESDYAKLTKDPRIEKIFADMPKDLSKLEKAYYIYIELGRIVKNDPKFVYAIRSEQIVQYDNVIDSNFFGICRSFSELYAMLLKDPRVGIEAELVKKNKNSAIAHIETVLKIDGKYYVANLIQDIFRIKNYRRPIYFGIDLTRKTRKQQLNGINLAFLEELQDKYGNISNLTEEQIDELSKKIGYSYVAPGIQYSQERGIYTDDTTRKLREEFQNRKLLKEYVFVGEDGKSIDVPEEEELKYKLEYIFYNMDKLFESKGEEGYLERIRNYRKIMQDVFTIEEMARIQAYAVRVGNDPYNIESIIQVKTLKRPKDAENSEGLDINWYYMYSKEEKKYVRKSLQEIKEFLNGTNRESVEIIGTYDTPASRTINPKEIIGR